MNRNVVLDKVIKLGVLGALSIVLVLVMRFPIIPGLSFLEFELGDVPIFLAGFAFGPWWALLLTAVVSLIQGLTVSAGSGFWGIVMHFISTGVSVVVASLIYQRLHTLKGSLIAMAACIVAKIVVMIICNMIITPVFLTGPTLSYEDARVIVLSMLGPIALFNVIKSVANGIVTYVLYKPLSKLFFKRELIK